MSPLESLAPLIDDRTRVLVLGSMPGAISLERGEYYAHPGNRFWRLMNALAGIPVDAPYPVRERGLLDAGVGLWDTIAHCEREGSLDSRIRDARPNDFGSFLGRHPSVQVIVLNGRKAATIFQREVLPAVPSELAERLTVLELPSTSPANARGGFPALMEKWKVLSRWIRPTSL